MSLTDLTDGSGIVVTHEGHEHATSAAPTPDASAMSGMGSTSGMDSMSGMSSTAPMPGMSASSGASGMSDMSGMDGMDSMSMGVDILPMWVSVIWIVALVAVLVFHCGHLVRMGGQHRWFHSAHIIMLVGMIYMYAMMAFNLNWVSSTVWMWLFVLTTAAMIIWMITRIVAKKPFSYLWIFALVQQAAMIYMWAPMSSWVAAFTWALVVYFTLETIAWLVGWCNDGKPERGNAVGPGDRSLIVPLGHGSTLGNISMAVMAASMAYMFAGMQLMV
jgi:hypothetical protein